MRSKIARRILSETPEDTKIYVRMYSDIVVRVHEILKEKGITQKRLAEGMNKKPSEISKWLGGDHNFTLRSLAKLEAELGEPIINVPKRKTFTHMSGTSFSMTVLTNLPPKGNSNFVKADTIKYTSKLEVA